MSRLLDTAAAGPVPVVRTAERVAYENRFVTVYDDEVRLARGQDGRYLRIVQSGGLPGVVVLPFAGDQVGLVQVYRYALGSWEWALPRGLAHGGDPEHTARRELLEELGAEPASLQLLGQVTPDSGLLATVVSVFAASYADEVASPTDTDEVAAVSWMPARSLQVAASEGEIRDSFTLSAMALAMCAGRWPVSAGG